VRGARSDGDDVLPLRPQNTRFGPLTGTKVPLPPCPLAGTAGGWGLLLPGAPEPRLTLLRRQGFRSVFQTAYAA
jgi:hypothetical protein